MVMTTNAKMTSSENGDLSSSISDISEHPMHTVLVAFPAVCFIGAFITDFVYWRSMSFVWANFSVWLLTVGLVMAGLVVIAALLDFIVNRNSRASRPAWPYVLGNGLVIVLSLFNVFVHSRDGYTSVVPTGIILSGIVVVILMITGWMGGEATYRRRAGVSY
jgi:uncharacterized membrane protein